MLKLTIILILQINNFVQNFTKQQKNSKFNNFAKKLCKIIVANINKKSYYNTNIQTIQ